MRPRPVVLMGHDVQRDPRTLRSTGEAGVSLPIDALLGLLDRVRARGHRFVTLGEFLSLRRREPVALLTFDDGYRSLHDELFPHLCELRIPALVFLIAGAYRDGYESFALQLFALRDHHAELAPEATARLEGLPGLARVVSRAGAGSLGELLRRPEAEVARCFADHLRGEERESLERDLGRLGVLPRTTLSPEEVARMQASGWVEFGAHSMSHVSFQRLSPSRVEREIVDSCAFLADMLGRPAGSLAFAYPYGAVTTHATRVVRRHCAAGFSTRPGCVTHLDRDWRIPRLELTPELPARLEAAGALRDAAAALTEAAALRLRPAAARLLGRRGGSP